ncbi:unnamed protein product [Didymodactylos carnosus]|uniref:Uncharacterized protein n=1 Tax=Didymodactylos carnosus TaxID=1234261 RepID=A0A814Q999_9BILA|nr:unnamed protein product [Didymodactylos carnosus]CAF3879946.1 unnamed protein product [Didymodactylos carnosus]
MLTSMPQSSTFKLVLTSTFTIGFIVIAIIMVFRGICEAKKLFIDYSNLQVPQIPMKNSRHHIQQSVQMAVTASSTLPTSILTTVKCQTIEQKSDKGGGGDMKENDVSDKKNLKPFITIEQLNDHTVIRKANVIPKSMVPVCRSKNIVFNCTSNINDNDDVNVNQTEKTCATRQNLQSYSNQNKAGRISSNIANVWSPARTKRLFQTSSTVVHTRDTPATVITHDNSVNETLVSTTIGKRYTRYSIINRYPFQHQQVVQPLMNINSNDITAELNGNRYFENTKSINLSEINNEFDLNYHSSDIIDQSSYFVQNSLSPRQFDEDSDQFLQYANELRMTNDPDSVDTLFDLNVLKIVFAPIEQNNDISTITESIWTTADDWIFDEILTTRNKDENLFQWMSTIISTIDNRV